MGLGPQPLPGPDSARHRALNSATTVCRVFAECHSLIPPGPFFHTCVSDSCQADTEVLCQNLEAYAALCRSRNMCVDWRNATSGLCGEWSRPRLSASWACLMPI